MADALGRPRCVHACVRACVRACFVSSGFKKTTESTPRRQGALHSEARSHRGEIGLPRVVKADLTRDRKTKRRAGCKPSRLIQPSDARKHHAPWPTAAEQRAVHTQQSRASSHKRIKGGVREWLLYFTTYLYRTCYFVLSLPQLSHTHTRTALFPPPCPRLRTAPSTLTPAVHTSRYTRRRLPPLRSIGATRAAGTVAPAAAAAAAAAAAQRARSRPAPPRCRARR